MQLKIFGLLLLLWPSATQCGLLSSSKGRVLSIADSLADVPATIDDFRVKLPDKPIQLGDLTSIVQKVARSTGLSIESEDAGLNVIDFRLSHSTGRSLNLLFNKDDDEIMHFTLKSDKEENLGESQFSTLGANQEDVQSILEDTIRSSGECERDRQLTQTSELTFENLEEKLFAPTQLSETWQISSKTDKLEYVFSPIGRGEGLQVTVALKKEGTKQGLLLQNREPGLRLTDRNHMVAFIGYADPPDISKLGEDLKSKLEAFIGFRTHEELPADIGGIVSVVEGAFSNYELIRLQDTLPGQRVVRIAEKDTAGFPIGSLYIAAPSPLDYIKIVLSFYSKIHTIILRAKDFSAKKIWILDQMKLVIDSQRSAAAGPAKIQAALAKKINAACGQSGEVRFEPKTETSYYFLSTRKDEDQACLFARSDIILTFHDFSYLGKLGSVQVSVTNPIVKTEMIFMPNPTNLEQSASDFILELFAELNDAKAFAEAPAEDGSLDLAKAEALLTEKGFSRLEGNAYEFMNEAGKAVVRLKEADELISVELVTQKNTIETGKSLNSSKQLWIPKGSKANEQKRFAGVIDNLKADLQK